MKIAEFCAALETALNEQPELNDRLHLVSTALQKAFKVKADEVAIFTIDRDNHDLCFLWPKRLVKAGRIPMTAHDSLLARTAREAKPYLDNRFANTRHASIFEKIPLSDPPEQPVPPIQKIMSAPMLRENAISGAIQLCRKGLDPDAAGADFSPVELEAFAAITRAVARHILA